MSEIDYVQEASHVDVYLADSHTAVHYPYRMQSVEHISPTTTDRSEHTIVDSDIFDDEVTNKDVVECAENYGARTVVPCDVLQNHTETKERVRDMAQLVVDSETVENMVVPIQGSSLHEYHLAAKDTVSMIEDSGYDDIIYSYALGGIKDAGSDGQIEHVNKVRDALGDNYNLHLFGGGMSMKWVKEIRENPNLLDSLDMSTPAHTAIAGDIMFPNMKRIHTNLPRGKHSSRPKGRMIEYMLTIFNFLISDGPRQSDVDELYEENGLI